MRTAVNLFFDSDPAIIFQRALACPQDCDVTLNNHFCTAKIDPHMELAEYRKHLRQQQVDDRWELPDRWTEGEHLRSIRSGHLLDVKQPTRRLLIVFYQRAPWGFRCGSFGFELRMGNPMTVQQDFFPNPSDYSC